MIVGLKKAVSLIISVLMLQSILITVSADDLISEERKIELGTDHIAGGQESNIYFGKYPQSSNGEVQPAGAEGVNWVKVGEYPLNWSGPYYNIDPIKWRVLKKSDTSVFLLSDQNLDGLPYHTDYEGVTWEKSTIRSWLNGYGKEENNGDADGNVEANKGIDYAVNNFKNMAFSSSDWDLIELTKVETPNNPWYGTPSGNDTEDKVFLLAPAETENTSYGFTDDGSRYASNPAYFGHRPGSSTTWWLRPSGCYTFYAATIGYEGWIDWYGALVTRNWIGVRPAINLNIAAVLFTSEKDGGYALTMLDPGREFAITDKSPKIASTGGNVSFNYTGAVTNEGGLRGNEYISAVLTDDKENVIHYMQLAKVEEENGTVTYTVPEKISSGNYTLMIFNEQYNGEKRTSYSSALKNNSIPLTVTEKQFEIISVDKVNKSAVVQIPFAGTYSMVFADYEEGKLNNLDIITKKFSGGRVTVTSEKEINLGTGDKVMLWRNPDGMEPLCEVKPVE